MDPDWLVQWETHGADAAAIAASLQANGPVLGVGHSMGGAALLMAALAQPQLFCGLVVYEPIVMPPELVRNPNGGPSPDNYLAIGARKRRSTFASFEDAIDNYSRKAPLNVFAPESMQAYVRGGFSLGDDGNVHLKCTGDAEARTYEAAGNHHTFEHLRELRVPVWVVCGRPEPMQPSSRMAALAEQIPDGRYIEFDQLGHFGPMQDPALIAELIATFPR
jgi:pimeloyl-ACP methyl ester carboxylesterase